MNKTRRKELERALELINEVNEILSVAKDEEQEYYDNMPESFQNGDKGEQASTAIENIESAMSSLEDVVSYLEEAKA